MTDSMAVKKSRLFLGAVVCDVMITCRFCLWKPKLTKEVICLQTRRLDPAGKKATGRVFTTNAFVFHACIFLCLFLVRSRTVAIHSNLLCVWILWQIKIQPQCHLCIMMALRRFSSRNSEASLFCWACWQNLSGWYSGLLPIPRCPMQLKRNAYSKNDKNKKSRKAKTKSRAEDRTEGRKELVNRDKLNDLGTVSKNWCREREKALFSLQPHSLCHTAPKDWGGHRQHVNLQKQESWTKRQKEKDTVCTVFQIPRESGGGQIECWRRRWERNIESLISQ